MNFFTLIFVIWTWQVCSSKPTNERNSNSASGISSASYPFHVLLRLQKNSEQFLICEGALIAKNYVVTAAGCVNKYKQMPKSLQVVAGAKTIEDLDSDEHVQKRSVIKIYLPTEWYSSKGQFGDLALVKLSLPLKLNDHVNTASFDEDVVEKEIYAVVGYGGEEELGVHTKLVTVYSKEECETAIGRNINSSTFCAKWKKKFVLENVDYYAGAPLSDRNSSSNKIYGISASKVFGTFTRLSDFKNWIEKITGVKASANEVELQTTLQSSNNGEIKNHHKDDKAYAHNAGGATNGSTDRTTTTTETTETDSSSDESSWESLNSESSENPTTAVSPTTSSSEGEDSTESNESPSEESEVATTTKSTTVASSEETSEENEDFSDTSDIEETTALPPSTTATSTSQTTQSYSTSVSSSSQPRSSTPAGTTAPPTSTSIASSTTTTPSTSSHPGSTTPTTQTTDTDDDDDTTWENDDATTWENDEYLYDDDSDNVVDHGSNQSSDTNGDSQTNSKPSAQEESVSRNSANTKNRPASLVPSLISKVGSIFGTMKQLKKFLIS